MESIFANEPFVRVSPGDIAVWSEQAAQAPRKRFRLCAHRPSDSVHEMIICLNQESYVRPHKHLGKSESFHVISGKARLLFFDEDGNLTQNLALGPYESGRTFFHRTSESAYHTVWVEDDCFVFHETTNGPFDPSETVYAPWAPAEDSDQISEYRKRLATLLEERS